MRVVQIRMLLHLRRILRCLLRAPNVRCSSHFACCFWKLLHLKTFDIPQCISTDVAEDFEDKVHSRRGGRRAREEQGEFADHRHCSAGILRNVGASLSPP